MNHEEKVITANFAQSYRDMRVFQQAYEISLMIHQIAGKLPPHEQFELAKQLRRSSKSVCANLAEGFGKQHQSKAEFRRFVMMAAGSAEESTLWLDYCRDLGYLNAQTVDDLQKKYLHVINMIHKLQQSLKGNS